MLLVWSSTFQLLESMFSRISGSITHQIHHQPVTCPFHPAHACNKGDLKVTVWTDRGYDAHLHHRMMMLTMKMMSVCVCVVELISYIKLLLHQVVI